MLSYLHTQPPATCHIQHWCHKEALSSVAHPVYIAPSCKGRSSMFQRKQADTETLSTVAHPVYIDQTQLQMQKQHASAQELLIQKHCLQLAHPVHVNQTQPHRQKQHASGIAEKGMHLSDFLFGAFASPVSLPREVETTGDPSMRASYIFCSKS